MLRRSLIAALLLAVSSPLAAQDEYVWSTTRPDADAPLGVVGAHVLEEGAFDLQYRFQQLNSQGVWFATDSLPLANTLQLYTVAPLTLSKQTHSVTGAFAVSPELTVTGTAEFSIFEREHLTDAGVYYVAGAEEIGDITANAIYEVYRQGMWRANLSFGVVIPVGESRTVAVTPFSGTATEAQPYDMRPGAGTFGLMPGATIEIQNEYGSVGGQFKGRINVGTGPNSYTLGDRYEASGWAAYKLNDLFSVSAGLRWSIWGNIEGADPLLDPLRDPGSDPVFLAGQRADMPVGINLLVPSGVLEGHVIQVETIYALHHDYEGPQLGLDWGINFGWKVPM